ncbi:MAG: Crp/Fnr family transcriptional regulator [Oxalobacteraceae bacterium]|nr:MAG: Crp/Fnr family transcriptional regulator [Oxalobacteraceae bacterium]
MLEGWTDYRGAIGLSELLGSRDSDTVWIVEKTGSALAVPAVLVQAMLERSTGFQRGVMTWLVESEHAARRRAAYNLTASAADKVRRVLEFVLSIHENHAPLTQGQLAAYVGTQRTTVCAVMQEMQAAGQIVYRRGKIRRPSELRRATEAVRAD